MPVVMVKLPRGAASLSSEMTNMRLWLDAHHSSPSRFHYDLLPDSVVVQVEFSGEDDADAFKQRFDSARNHPREAKATPRRETMSQIALSYERMAEDLERRLGERRYRNGLIVP